MTEARRCENPKCRRPLPPPGYYAGKKVEARFCLAGCRSAMSQVRRVEKFARARSQAETCPTCRGALGHDGPVLFCLDRDRCGWSVVVKLSDVRKASAARRSPEPAPAPKPRVAKPRGPQHPKPGTTTGRALALLVTRPEGMEAHEIERALGLTFPVALMALMALRRLLALSLAKRDPETRRYTATRGVATPAMRYLQTPELRGLVAALATLSPVMVKRVVTAAAEVRASAGKA